MNKKSALWPLVSFIVLAAAILSACGPAASDAHDIVESPAAQAPTAETLIAATEEEIEIFEADPEHLLPCGAFEEMRLLQAPAPVTPVATITPDPNAPTPLPAPSEDRVGMPEDFETDFKLLYVFDRPDRKLARAICGNDIAAQHKEGEPFDYGSVLLMISYSAKLDANGQPSLDENGHYIREKHVAYHVMRKEKGFGEAYGENRAGEWEFAGYYEDGSYEARPEKTNFCAACHSGQGGESIDHVFRMNLFHEGEAALTAPPVDENEISIYLYSFHEPELEVKTGTTITWINDDQADHKIMSAVKDDQGRVVPDPNHLFSSEVLPSVTIQSGASFSFTFDEPGEYWYICTIHNNMTGRIIVTE